MLLLSMHTTVLTVGSDFQSELLVVQLSPRELQKCVNITVHDDLLLEKDEKINISMIIPENQDGVLGGEFAIENMSPTVCIIDDDGESSPYVTPKPHPSSNTYVYVCTS